MNYQSTRRESINSHNHHHPSLIHTSVLLGYRNYLEGGGGGANNSELKYNMKHI